MWAGRKKGVRGGREEQTSWLVGRVAARAGARACVGGEGVSAHAVALSR